MTSLPEKLCRLSHEIGCENRQLAILGEGNTSARSEKETFWIKASGSSLATLEDSGLTQVRSDIILAALDNPSLSDHDVREILLESRVDIASRLPSVETFMHAVCFQETDAQWIGHCHPVSVLQILCSTQGANPFLQHIFPDEIVVCGHHLAVVPYIDPGLELARHVRAVLQAFKKEHRSSPKVILLENHGPVALGQNDREVFNILLMLDKWAKVLVGNFACGHPNFLPDRTSARIDTRPDEHYRRMQIKNHLH